MLFFFLILFLFKKFKLFEFIETYHFILLVSLSALMVLVISIHPNYVYVPFYQAFQHVQTGIQNLLAIGASTLPITILKMLFSHSLTSYIFQFHVACILVLAIKEYINSHRALESFNNVLEKTNKPSIKALFQKFQKEQMEGDTVAIQKTLIGYQDKSLKKPVYLDDNARHVFVCGTTGTGKTVALSNAIESAIVKDYPLVVVDGKGDLDDGSILDIINRFKGSKKLYVVNMSDIKNSCFYNPFRDATSTIAKDMLVSLTDWSEEHYKANTERYIQRLVYLMELNNIPLSFDTLLNYFDVENLKELSAESYKNEQISKNEHLHTLEIIKTSGSISLNASARFITLQESEIGHLLNSKGLDIYKAIEENAIILFVLNPLIYPELTKLFGRLILTDCKKAVSKLYTNRKERVFFLFDEINTYASSVLIDLLNKSRSANVTCFCATQSLADLEESSSEAFREQVIENCNNYILLRQNSAKYSEVWAKTFGTKDSISITYQIGNDGKLSHATGRGSATKEREYIYHPDFIKSLKTGQGIFVSKDTGLHTEINIRKGF